MEVDVLFVLFGMNASAIYSIPYLPFVKYEEATIPTNLLMSVPTTEQLHTQLRCIILLVSVIASATALRRGGLSTPRENVAT